MNNYLYYWKNDEVRTYMRRGETLDYAASRQFGRKHVRLGDVIWIVSSMGLNLELVGNIEVGALVSKAEAESILGRSGLFGHDGSMQYAINTRRGLQRVARIDITGQADQLEFVDSKGNPTRGLDVLKAIDPRQRRTTFGQALQSMRRVSPGTAALLNARLSA